jgi:hypothetical protein
MLWQGLGEMGRMMHPLESDTWPGKDVDAISASPPVLRQLERPYFCRYPTILLVISQLQSQIRR